jgi:carbamoyl-phosphate synthase large subunit
MTEIKRRRLHVLLTSVGGLGVPHLIGALRQLPEFDLTISGVDTRPDAVGAHFVDYFVRVPPANAPEYSETVLEVCRKNSVELVIPLSDPEAVALSEAESRFAAVGCTVLGSPYDATRVAVNKYQWLCHLRDSGVPVPRFHQPRSVDAVDAALADLGFPHKRVVLKPAASAGTRGFRLITAEFDELSHVLTTKRESLLSPRRLHVLLREATVFPQILLMEYLEGDSISADVLVRERRAACVICQRRLWPTHGPVEAAVLERDVQVDEAIERILRTLPLRYVVNIDLVYRRAPREGGVFPVDINPRPSATIATTGGAGSFLLADAMLDAVGIERPSKDFRRLRVLRYWNEKYLPVGFPEIGNS